MDNLIKEKFFDHIKTYGLIEKNDKILVALSGGADSVFLLSILNHFKDYLKIQIFASHINHNLRDTASRDEKFCMDLCNKLNIPIEIISEDVLSFKNQNDLSVEEAARILRYKKLDEVANKFNCNKIATAHNLEDNTETVLLNIIKGTGFDGIKGIPVKRDNIIRPILIFSKNEIIEYLEKNKISFVTDETNFDNIYQRNFLRNKILPELRDNINPKLDVAVFNLSRIVDGFNGELIDYDFVDDVLMINKKYWNDDQIKKIVKRKLQLELNNVHLKNLKKLKRSKISTQIELPSNFLALNDRDFIIIYSNKKYDENNVYMLDLKNNFMDTDFFNIFVNKIDKIDVNLSDKKENEEYIDADLLKDDTFKIRRWKKDDYFYPFGSKVKIKISDFLSNSKVPIIKRKNIWVAENSGNIVLVLGLRLDNRYKITNQTNKVLKICYTLKTKLLP